MHHSWYLRPAFIAFAAYALLLSLQRHYFGPPNPPACDVCYQSPVPSGLQGRVKPFPRRNGEEVWFELDVEKNGGEAACGKVMVSVPAGQAPRSGALLSVSGALVKTGHGRGLSGPGYAGYLHSMGIYSVLEGGSVREIRAPNPLQRAVNVLRGRMISVFERALGAERAAVLSGITLGERASISRELNRAFRDSGAMHILVASGSNVGMVTFIVFLLARFARAGRRWAGFAAVLTAGFYTLLAGADTPLLRAYVMSVFGTAGFLLERESGLLHGLVLAALALVIADPQTLFRPDFQMSFASTAALLVALSVYKPPKEGRILRWSAQLFIAGAAAQLALFPLMAGYFHRVSLAPLLSNFFVIPLASLLMSGGFALALLSPLPLVFTPLSWLIKGLLDFLVMVVQGSAAWGLTFEVPSPGPAFTICFYCAVFLLLHLPGRGLLKHLWKPAAAVAVFSLLFALFHKPAPQALVLGAGYQRSVLFSLPDGELLLFGSAVNGDMLADAVLSRGRKRLEALFISGCGGDALSGLEALSRRIKIKRIFAPYGPADEKYLPLLKSAVSLWPGDSVPASGWKASLEWPFYRDLRLRRTVRPGYNGSVPQSYSWRLDLPEAAVELGAGLRGADIRSKMGEFDIIFPRGQRARIIFSDNINIRNDI